MKHSYKELVAALFLTLCLFGPIAVGQQPEAEQYSDVGQKALASGNYAEAERAYEKLRDLEPGIAEVHANLGLIYFEKENSSKRSRSCGVLLS